VIDQWYYWHEADILGPFSGKQLAALAAAGDILPSDTVWKDGVEEGVPASKVQHLFAAVGTEIAADGAAAVKPDPAAIEPLVAPEPVARWDGVRQSSGGRARAVAGTGTTIVGQDGKTVKFRMKCTKCGSEDRSWKTLPITRGTIRANYYCPKCRKMRQVELTGHIG
jgi:GYF domain 2